MILIKQGSFYTFCLRKKEKMLTTSCTYLYMLQAKYIYIYIKAQKCVFIKLDTVTWSRNRQEGLNDQAEQVNWRKILP